MKAVRYHPDWCDEAKAEYVSNGSDPWRWDSSHDLSLVMDDGTRIKVGTFKHADWARNAGKWIETNTISNQWKNEPFPTIPQTVLESEPK